MNESRTLPRIIRFGQFKCDVCTGELHKDGVRVRLPDQPFRLLTTLLERPGELVTRKELQEQLWPNQSYGDFNDGLNTAVNKLRQALNDRADNPRFIQTIPRRGYRFTEPVEVILADPVPTGHENGSPPAHEDAKPEIDEGGRWSLRDFFGLQRIQIPATILAGLGVFLWMASIRRTLPKARDVQQITHFGRASRVVTDGTRLYIMQRHFGGTSVLTAPIDGGGTTHIQTPFQNTRLLDISLKRRELLVAGFDHWSDPWKVWIMPLGGGAPRRLGNVVSDSARWSPDGSRIAFEDQDGALYTVNSDGSNVKEVLKDGGKVDGWSPDGDRLCFTRLNPATGGTSLWQVQTDGTNLQPMFPERQSPFERWGAGQNSGRWTPDGKYFLFHDTLGVYAVREQKTFLQVHEPAPIRIYMPPYSVDDLALGPKGRRLFMVGRNERRELVRFDQGLHEFVPFHSDLQVAYIGWSPNGRWLAYTTVTNAELWRVKADGSERIQLTASPMQAFGPVWSPDGSRLAFHILMPGEFGKICLLPAQGGVPKVLLPGTSTAEDGVTWSPDGKKLMFGRNWLDQEGKTLALTIATLDLKTGKLSRLPGSKGLGSPVWSPSGRYVVATSGDLTRLMLFDFHSHKWRQIAAGGLILSATWSHDSKSLYFQDAKGGQDEPIYRYWLSTGRLEKVATRKNLLSPDTSRYLFKGLTPHGSPVAVEIQDNSDVYALDLYLP